MRIWVLTEMVNAYDQYGEDIRAIFIEKPTVEMITQHEVSINTATRLLQTGGGRISTEDAWTYLYEMDISVDGKLKGSKLMNGLKATPEDFWMKEGG